MKIVKKTLFFSLSVLLGLVFFVLAFRKAGLVNVAEVLNGLIWWQLLVLSGVTILIVLAGAGCWAWVLKFFGEKLTFKTLLSSLLAGMAISNLTPAMGIGGEPAQYLLAKREARKKKNLIASMVIDKLLYGTINYLLVVAGAFLLALNIPLPFKIKWLIILFLFTVAALGGFFYFNIFKNRKFIGKINHHLLAALERRMHRFFRWKNPYLWGLVGFSFFRALLFVLRFYLLVAFFGVFLSFEELFLIIGVLLLTGMLPIPSTLGVFELSQALVFEALNLSGTLGVSMILVMRFFDLIIVGLGLSVLFKQSFKSIRMFFRQLG